MRKSILVLAMIALVALFAISCNSEPVHEHEYVEKRNDENHWKECECGEKIEVSKHVFSAWVVSEDGTVTRTCGCGYEETATEKGISVATEDELNNAIENRLETIYLSKDIAVKNRFRIIGKKVSIDFNGYKITLDEKFTDKGDGPFGLITIDNECELTLKDSSNGKGGIDATTVANDKVESCIVIYPDPGHKAKLSIDGGIYNAPDFAVSGNGFCIDDGCTEIAITGGTFRAETAIYHPQNGIMKITDGTFIGTESAIEVRAGKVEIADGSFTSEADAFACDENGNGTTTKGAAIAVAQHSTQLAIDVSIKGGSYKGVKALSNENPQNNPAEALKKVKLSVSGGKFSTDPSEFIPEGFKAEKSENNWIVSSK